MTSFAAAAASGYFACDKYTLERMASAEYFEALANKEAKVLGYIHGIAESVTNQSGIFEYFDNDFVKSEALAALCQHSPF